jgi:hypothetical protein
VKSGGAADSFQFGNPGAPGFAVCILASHPFRKERGKSGAPGTGFKRDLELRVGTLSPPDFALYMPSR